MTKLEYKFDSNRCHKCENCGRNTPVGLIWTLELMSKTISFKLCEDCSNSIPRLHYKVMENGESYKYKLDEYVKITDKVIDECIEQEKILNFINHDINIF